MRGSRGFPYLGADREGLAVDFPNNTRVQRHAWSLTDRSRPSLESEITVGRTSGGDTRVSGNRDSTLRTRLSSPWTARDIRGFIEHRRVTATFDKTEGRYDRLGAGLEWSARRGEAWLRADRERLGDPEPGIAAGWGQWLDDHWRVGAEAESHSLQTPLRAAEVGITGRHATVSADWRGSESLSAYAGLGVLDLDDGNRRWSAQVGGTRRVHARAHHTTDIGIDGYYQHNTQPGGAYFNPRHTATASVRGNHDWITWRRYERKLVQHFHVGAGVTDQSGFGSDPVVELRYEHRWDVTRRWSLDYGVGWDSRVYDGDRERRTYGLLRLRGTF
ncbi:MAG: hypothetical protein U5L11_08645 [Arhodomonas sp.]|nr:hypothetical protein [Arhodomonas sp.]